MNNSSINSTINSTTVGELADATSLNTFSLPNRDLTKTEYHDGDQQREAWCLQMNIILKSDSK